MTATTSIIIVPGWRDSGPGHWQSLWAERLPHACRVVQDDWITPTRSAWVSQLEKTVLAAPQPEHTQIVLFWREYFFSWVRR